MTGQFDILVIGDDEAALCAAAAAAKAGARTGLVRQEDRRRKLSPGSAPAVPNFVWRRLDLQDYDLVLEPASARVTLFKDKEPLATYANPRETADALAATGVDDSLLWRDFISDAAAIADDNYLASSYLNGAVESGKSFASFISDPSALDRASRFFGPCADLLGDYFTDDRLMTHVAAHALGPGGYGDREIGSTAAVVSFFSEESWRVRTPKDAQSLRAVLELVCQNAGVEMLSGAVRDVASVNGKPSMLTVGDVEKIRVKYIFFATPDAASEAGALHNHGSAPGERAEHATLTMRFRLSEPIDPPTGDDKAVFQIIDSHDDIQGARDAAVLGKLYEKPPIEFEFTAAGEIVARTAYLPGAFYEDGEWRGWTGQDRQAAAALIKERISSRLPEFSARVRRTESELSAPVNSRSLRPDRAPFAKCDCVIVQPQRHNAIGAAVRLIDKVLAGDE
ncbi:MAG: hypothetical protein R3C58_14480 [Parvularculaceae bacterium]